MLFLKAERGTSLLRHRSKFVPIHNRALVAVFAEFASDDLDALPDLEFVEIRVGELGLEHWSFIEFDHADGVRHLVFVPQGRLAQNGK